MLTKEYILGEIRRTADSNGGVALGKQRFETATGIHEHDWSGRFWARWSDAVAEAGLQPNKLQERFAEEDLLRSLAEEIRRLGKLPTAAELKLRRRVDNTFPSASVFARLGSKSHLTQKVLEYARASPEWADVAEILAPLAVKCDADPEGRPEFERHGFVYLLRSGRYYKIGHTSDVGRRRYDLALQLPEAVSEEHSIRTDDPPGIERYWHERFADRRKNGEWFALTRADIAAFKRRKFM